MLYKKFIFIDVDGTLCVPNGEVPKSAAEAIRSARKNGHQIFLCTGRSKPEILESILSIGFDGVIGAGGGYIEIDGKVVNHQTMPEASVIEIVDYFDKNQVGYYLESNNGLFGSVNCKYIIRKTITMGYSADSEEYLNADKEFHWFYNLLNQYKNEEVDYGNVNKISFISSSAHPFTLVNDRFKNHFEIYRSTVAQFGSESGEISISNVNKYTSIQFVMEYLGINKLDTMAYGDGDNDVKMFEAVCHGVAVENATEELKKLSKEITARAEEDGLWKSFRLNGLI